MGRFAGNIGFSMLDETEPGVFEDMVIERRYFGDTIRRRIQMNNVEYSSNPTLTLSNEISIIANKFAYDHLGFMKYVVYKGQKWAIQSAVPEPPRIILTIGGLYNGNTPGAVE